MNPTRGILCKISALFLFAIMASLIKASSPHVPAWQAAFFRSFFAMPIILLWLAQRHDLREGLRTTKPLSHVARGVVGVAAMIMGFTALGLLPLPEVTAIGFASPLFTVMLAALLLGERIRFFRISALAIGLVGVSIIIYPRLSLGDGGAAETLLLFGGILALGSAFLRALAQVFVRKLVQTEHTAAVVFYFSLTATVISLMTIPFGWVMPTPIEFFYLISAGVVGGIAQILLTSGYRFAQASTLAPFDYMSMLYALLIGYFIFAELPTLPMLIGCVIVMGSGSLIVYRERQLGLKRDKSRPNNMPTV